MPPSQAKRSSEVSAWPNGVCARRTSPSTRVRDAERAERGLERRAQAVDARADDADALRRRAAAEQREQLLADELERAARARALEEANRAVDRHAARGDSSAEERALEMRERRVRDLAVARRQLLDARPRRGAARSSAVRRSDANAGRPGSYGSDTLTSVRPASASSSAHCAPVRSSKP